MLVFFQSTRSVWSHHKSWVVFDKEPRLCSRWEPGDISSLQTEGTVTGKWNSSGTALRGHCSKQWSDMPSSHFLGMSRLTLHNLSEKTSPKSDCLRVGKLFLVSNPNLFLFSFVSVIFISPSLQSVSLFFNESWLFQCTSMIMKVWQ